MDVRAKQGSLNAEDKMSGIHHVTAIAGDPQKNFGFYTRDLGLRFVKKTVNFDDPATYHFYYGDEAGHPGSILTFFPWEGAPEGRRGVGETHQTTFRVPQGGMSLRAVARLTLGTEQRWGDIYDLNPQITKPDAVLPAGTGRMAKALAPSRAHAPTSMRGAITPLEPTKPPVPRIAAPEMRPPGHTWEKSPSTESCPMEQPWLTSTCRPIRALEESTASAPM